MSLSLATDPHGQPLPLPEGGAPYAIADLLPWVGVPIQLPCEDPWLLEQGTLGHTYLQAAAEAWQTHPEWMDFLDQTSPAWDLKRAERDLYLHSWQGWRQAKRVMDVGCGIGRFATKFLDLGADVWGVDGDLQSLQHCLWHSVGRPGRLDLHWSSATKLPEVGDLDAVVSCEVLCYVPELEAVLDALHARLRPGGKLFLGMEARWGWATATDAPEGAIDEALAGTGVLHVPGERYVRTFEGDELTTLLADHGFDVEACDATHYFTDGPLEGLLPSDLSFEQLLGFERRARVHPVWKPLNRIWSVSATKR